MQPIPRPDLHCAHECCSLSQPGLFPALVPVSSTVMSNSAQALTPLPARTNQWVVQGHRSNPKNPPQNLSLDLALSCVSFVMAQSCVAHFPALTLTWGEGGIFFYLAQSGRPPAVAFMVDNATNPSPGPPCGRLHWSDPHVPSLNHSNSTPSFACECSGLVVGRPQKPFHT